MPRARANVPHRSLPSIDTIGMAIERLVNAKRFTSASAARESAVSPELTRRSRTSSRSSRAHATRPAAPLNAAIEPRTRRRAGSGCRRGQRVRTRQSKPAHRGRHGESWRGSRIGSTGRVAGGPRPDDDEQLCQIALGIDADRARRDRRSDGRRPREAGASRTSRTRVSQPAHERYPLSWNLAAQSRRGRNVAAFGGRSGSGPSRARGRRPRVARVAADLSDLTRRIRPRRHTLRELKRPRSTRPPA